MGNKLDDSCIEWSSGQEDGCLSTKFDQSLLAAKKEMSKNLKASILGKVAKAKSRQGARKNKAAQQK
jgi:hypothetical protein